MCAAQILFVFTSPFHVRWGDSSPSPHTTISHLLSRQQHQGLSEWVQKRLVLFNISTNACISWPALTRDLQIAISHAADDG
jgi:hypothetical protein